MNKPRALGAAITMALSLPWISCAKKEPVPLFRSSLDGFTIVEEGGFRMGDRFGDKDETSVTKVSVSSFLISDCEVTRIDFAAFLKEAGREAPWSASELPATNLSWNDALSYCDWLSRKRGLEPVYARDAAKADWKASGYRLPTEAEWEFAARGGRLGRDKALAGGNDEGEIGWYGVNADAPRPVKQKRPNELGLYDMSGNVWEWCWDSYGMYSGRDQADPRGAPPSGWKVLRGGSWRFPASDLRVSNRYYADEKETLDDAGFRLARSVRSEADAALLERAKEARKAVRGGPDEDIALPPPPADAPYLNPSLAPEARAKDLLSRMSLAEKAGQMTQAAVGYLDDPDNVRAFALGSVLSGGGMGPPANDPAAWAEMTDTLQRAALKTRLRIPMIYGIDAVHGHNNVHGAVIYPHNVGIGASGDEGLSERIGAAVARDMLAAGTRWNFAPCVAVSRDERWGRTYESYGEDPALVSRMGAAYVRGLQGMALGPDSVAATAKHFLADGGTRGGKDRGGAVGDEALLRSVFLPPYRAALNAGAASVMASYSSWNEKPMHGNRDLLTGLLKEELGFKGVLVSDWGAQKFLPGNAKEQLRVAVNAGLDVIMVPDAYEECRDAIVSLAKSGRIPMERIDDAVTRILLMKFRLGLFEKPFARKELLPEVGGAASRALGREAARKSLVLLKNSSGVLPLTAGQKNILIAGTAAHDIGAQCGGWTITWQGLRGDITPGTTILEGIAAAAKARGISLSYSVNGKRSAQAEKPDLVILVLAEDPYAEMEGDRQSLLLPEADRALVRDMKALGAPLVLVLVSGRPLVMTEEIGLADAFMAAWLPGTEGGGVADILFGEFPPTGKLPFSWPRDMAQIPINAGDGKEGLFPLGAGLSY